MLCRERPAQTTQDGVAERARAGCRLSFLSFFSPARASLRLRWRDGSRNCVCCASASSDHKRERKTQERHTQSEPSGRPFRLDSCAPHAPDAARRSLRVRSGFFSLSLVCVRRGKKKKRRFPPVVCVWSGDNKQTPRRAHTLPHDPFACDLSWPLYCTGQPPPPALSLHPIHTWALPQAGHLLALFSWICRRPSVSKRAFFLRLPLRLRKGSNLPPPSPTMMTTKHTAGVALAVLALLALAHADTYMHMPPGSKYVVGVGGAWGGWGEAGHGKRERRSHNHTSSTNDPSHLCPTPRSLPLPLPPPLPFLCLPSSATASTSALRTATTATVFSTRR